MLRKLEPEPRDVTLEPKPSGPEKDRDGKDAFEGQQFPCPLCGIGLPLRLSRVRKPYMVCNACGLQLFFRGKQGIRKLRETLEAETLISGATAQTHRAVTLWNRLEQLQQQRQELKAKRGFFLNPNLKNAIAAVSIEIERLERELQQIATRTEKDQ